VKGWLNGRCKHSSPLRRPYLYPQRHDLEFEITLVKGFDRVQGLCLEMGRCRVISCQKFVILVSKNIATGSCLVSRHINLMSSSEVSGLKNHN
jgi:hypothetical protein